MPPVSALLNLPVIYLFQLVAHPVLVQPFDVATKHPTAQGVTACVGLKMFCVTHSRRFCNRNLAHLA